MLLTKINYLYASWTGTAILLISGLLATAFESMESFYAAISLGIFAIGVLLCALAFGRSLEKSRYLIVTTGDLFLLSTSFPRRIRIWLWSSFAVNLVTGIVLAGITTSTNFAFGILASVYPLGNVNMWAISHGSYRERTNTSNN
tara:strand:- start:162 stop:593 length:432 start_codon:yes stop_codon:yes gene_type:complete